MRHSRVGSTFPVKKRCVADLRCRGTSASRRTTPRLVSSPSYTSAQPSRYHHHARARSIPFPSENTATSTLAQRFCRGHTARHTDWLFLYNCHLRKRVFRFFSPLLLIPTGPRYTMQRGKLNKTSRALFFPFSFA